MSQSAPPRIDMTVLMALSLIAVEQTKTTEKTMSRCNVTTSYYCADSSLYTVVHEGEDVLVARSCEEKDVVMDCYFWRILQR